MFRPIRLGCFGGIFAHFIKTKLFIAMESLESKATGVISMFRSDAYRTRSTWFRLLDATVCRYLSIQKAK